ncbi:hypothetical protein JG688_00009569 [Phytophthora aleatoria]|uniref:PexRD2 WYL domain-containing protein n=1 Tax=Phytophthora aleatoria TaxID=2496075 RepID=A0A8J5ITJ4_9STRA|nr:hypothetical protein JG688_00009569 [Phytophthora aleatoria]
MRLSQVLVAIATSFLIASEASSTTTDSTKDANIDSATSLSQRGLRIHPEDNAVLEERVLSPEKMMAMMKGTMTKEKYAEKLGITKQLEGFTKKNIEGMLQFMQTHKYQKYQNYANFLEDKGKSKKYADLVAQIWAK